MEEIRETWVTRRTINTISGGFARGGETSFSRKRYARSIMHISQNPISKKKGKLIVIGFLKRDSEGVLAHENGLMVIKVQIQDWSVKWVLIDLSSPSDILYRDAFKGMYMDTSELLSFKAILVSFFEEQVQVLGHLPIMTIFGSGSNVKGIRVRYLIVNVTPYIPTHKLLHNLIKSTTTQGVTPIKHILLCNNK